MKKATTKSNAVNKDLHQRLIKAKSVIDAEFSKKMSIHSLAKHATLSEFHFYRSFKNAFGISPHQYVLNKRLNRAVELLKEGDYLLTDIAYEVGFTDIYSFSKSFKKRFNTCPSQLLQN